MSSRRRGRAALVERLEPRTLLAGNLRITDFYVTDSSGNELTSVAAGQVVYLQAEFQTTGLAANASYDVQMKIVNEIRSVNLDWGAGLAGTGNWVARLGTWLVPTNFVPAGSAATVSLDHGADVAETNESDNTRTFFIDAETFGPKFVKPMEGNMGTEWAFVNYNDTDRDSGVCHDPYGGPYCYDGHNGWDWSLPNFYEMDRGYDVYAAAGGEVIEVNDGEFDRQTGSNNDSGNYVKIDHGGGWVTTYWHFRKYSIQVQEGQTVTPGQKLGLVGSSGNSTDAHLHWGVYYDDRLVDPGVAPSTYLQFSQPYPDTRPSVIDADVTTYNAGSEMKERPSRAEYFSAAGGQTVWYWMRLTGTETGDDLTVRWYRPNGTQYTSSSWDPGLIRYGSWNATLNLPVLPTTGEWEVAAFINGVEQPGTRRSFFVSSTLQPQVRMLSGGNYFVDGRTTPFDFGTITEGQGTEPTRTFTVQNFGSANLTTSSLTVPAGFTVTEGLSATIAPGGSDTFTLRLDDNVAGQKLGFVSFTTNDPSTLENVQSFRVEGYVRSASEVVAAFLGETPDNVYIRRNASVAQADIWVDKAINLTPTLSVPIADMASFTLSTLGGDDVVTVDYTNGNPLHANGMIYSGGAGTDELRLIGDDAAEAFLLTQGQAWVGLSRVNHSSIANFNAEGRGGDDIFNIGSTTGDAAQLDVAGTNITLSGGAGDDTLNLNDNSDAGNDLYTLTSTTFDKTSFGLLTYSTFESISLDANPDNSTIHVQSLPSTVSLTVNGADGDDAVTIGNGDVGSVDGAVTVNGQVGTDSLRFNDTTFNLASPVTITPTAVTRPFSGGTTYATVESLTYDSGPLGSSITVNGTAATTPVLIKPNDGIDTIHVNETHASAPVTIAPSAGFESTFDTVNVNLDDTGTARVLFNETIRLNTLSFGNGGQATVPTGTGKTLAASVLAFSGGVLDLTTNDLLVFNGNLSTITALITAGAVFSSSASLNTALGVIVSDAGDGSPLYAEFGGFDTDANDVLVKYTYKGDANLSGKVDILDLFRIDSGRAMRKSGWFNGDFNYSGSHATADDYMLIDRAFMQQGAPLAAASAASAPPEAQDLFGPIVQGSADDELFGDDGVVL